MAEINQDELNQMNADAEILIEHISPFGTFFIKSLQAIVVQNNQRFTKQRIEQVLPQYDIRTDKWDIAQSAMDLANASKIAKSKGLKKPEETQQNGDPQQNGE